MTRSPLAILFLLLTGVSAFATAHPEYTERENRPQPPRISLGATLDAKSHAEEDSLPLECRGYYLQAKTRRPAISRCE